jgi:hypothetical protein
MDCELRPSMKHTRPAGWRHCLFGLALLLACWPMAGHAADFLLKWHANNESDLQGYYLYYQEGVSVTAEPAGALKINIALDAPGFDADNPGHTLTGLKEDTLYYFAVSAYNAAGESGLSEEVSLSKHTGEDSDDGTSGAGSSGNPSDSGSSGGCFIGAMH